MLIPASVALAALSALVSAPSAAALNPAARWGHQAVYVPKEGAMYVIGGQIRTPGTQITNEVLVLPLNGTNPSYASGPSSSLTPHAFAAAALARDGSAIVLAGGLTSDCGSDSLTHTYTPGSGGAGSGAWTSATPDRLVRRRGAAMGAFDDGSAQGKMMLVGGISDSYSCASSTSTFPAADVLSLPMSSSSVISTRNLPSDLTGSALSVSDFALTTSASGNAIYLVGGQTSSGDLAPMSALGMWTPSAGWTSQKLGGTAPVGRLGASLVAHPHLDLLILHGGARDDRGSSLSTSLLAFINTTTWEWSIPSHLQPPQSSAAAWHSAVMTEHGVMIVAFGLANSGDPRSDTHYLDLRDPSGDAWTWKGQWSSAMLQPFSAGSSGSDQSNANTNTNGNANSNGGSSPSPRKLASILAPTLIILALILPVAIYLIRRQVRINRKRRMARYFSFSSAEDSGEFRSPGSRARNPPSTPALGSPMAPTSRGGAGGTERASRFALPAWAVRRGSADSIRDGNERDTTWFQDAQAGLSGAFARLSGRAAGTPGNGTGERSTFTTPTAPGRRNFGPKIRAGRGEKNMNWEEIDFGLGQVDQSRRGSAVGGVVPSSRRSSFSATSSPPANANAGPFSDQDQEMTQLGSPIGMANGVTYRPIATPQPYPYVPPVQTQSQDAANPFADPLVVNYTDSPTSHSYYADQSPRGGSGSAGHASGHLIPSLVVLPPTAHPTPAEGYSAAVPSVRPVSPSPSAGEGLAYMDEIEGGPAASATGAGAGAGVGAGAELDWAALQASLEARPAFRSISPTSTLRSHQAGHQAPIDPQARRPSISVAIPSSPSASAPALPPLDFQARRASSSAASTHSVASSASGRTITLVNPKTGRRTSETLPYVAAPGSMPMPMTMPTSSPVAAAAAASAGGMPRSASSPLALRHLAGSSKRHSSGGAPSTSGPHPLAGHGASWSPASPASTTHSYGSPTISTATLVRVDHAQGPAPSSSSSQPPARRASVQHGHAHPHAPAFGGAGMAQTYSADGLAGLHHGRARSALRVVNPSDSDDESATAPGQAL